MSIRLHLPILLQLPSSLSPFLFSIRPILIVRWVVHLDILVHVY